MRLGVDAAHFVFVGLDHHDTTAKRANDRHRIGQIIFALAVGVADLLQHLNRNVAIQGHDPGIAQRDRPFLGAGVGLLADRDKLSGLHYQPAVPGRVDGMEPQHRQPRALRQRRAQPLERRRRNQRRIAERHQ